MSMIQLLNTSAHDTGLPDLSVHMIATSPPYWGLRKYAGEQGVSWPAVEYSPMPGLPALSIPAMRCELGLEETPEAYIGHLILCLREWWRVLRNDGTCWVNLGDSYASNPASGGSKSSNLNAKRDADGALSQDNKIQGITPDTSYTRPAALKQKDLCGIPWRFAFAAQADGWYLRSDIIWAKPNPMPESVTDRCTKAHEYIFLLAKSQKYFYDNEAVKEESTDPEGSAKRYAMPFNVGDKEVSGRGRVDGASNTAGMKEFTGKRNRRTVWNIATRSYSGAHFATWPPALVRPMILAGTSARGVCSICGSQWERVVELGKVTSTGGSENNRRNGNTDFKGSDMNCGTFTAHEHITTGWRATCEHDAETIPATVLDPFSGSGTTGVAALDLGRAYIGIDISTEYVTKLAAERIGGTQIGFGL